MAQRTVHIPGGSAAMHTMGHDDRYWNAWADWLDVPRHTLSATVGAVVARGQDNAEALRLLRLGVDLADEYAAREAAGRGEDLTEDDLYADVRTALTALRAAGLRVVIAGNQTERAGVLLRGLELPADAVAMSAEWGVAKPQPEFFARLIELTGHPADVILYVGDHPANDVFPAHKAGLRTAHIRRGPWGHLWADDPDVRATADWSIRSLGHVATIVTDGWRGAE